MSDEDFFFLSSLADGLQFVSPSLKNGLRMPLDFKDFRFDCERRLGLPRRCPRLSLGLIFGCDISTPQQGQQEIALEASNFCGR